MRDEVDPGLRRQALRTLFRNPRFNVMDGLDTYIDDYSKPDPIPADWLGKLNQMARLGDFSANEEKSETSGTPGEDSASAENPVDEQTVATASEDDGIAPAEEGSPPPDLKHS